MAKISCTSSLKRFFPSLEKEDIQADTLLESIDRMNQLYPGFKAYVLDEHENLREFLHIYVNDELLKERKNLAVKLNAETTIYIAQAISGG